MGWILTGKSMHHDTTTLARYVPDLAKDKFHVWITKYHYVPMIVLGVMLFAIGGLPFLLWGVFFRTVIGLHATWLVNSATHSWGSRYVLLLETSPTNSAGGWPCLPSGKAGTTTTTPILFPSRHGLKW